MADQLDVSVVISTYNRCELLPKTLQSVLHQEAGHLRYEVIIVDNNSTDRTREVVESWQAQGHDNLRYVFEGRQGVSYGRNTGIAAARTPIVAFTDDDVFPSADWVARIASALHDYPEMDYVGGKSLAVTGTRFPRWLTGGSHWAPIAVIDYGDSEITIDQTNQLCLATCNLAFRREVFTRIQPFSPEFKRSEDYELQLRLWQAGGKGLYLPGLVVYTEVPPHRLTKRYHREWNRIQGRERAMTRSEDVERSSARLFDVPAHMVRQAGIDVFGLLAETIRGRSDLAFAAETRLHFFGAFFRERRKEFKRSSSAGDIQEILRFIRELRAR